MSNRVDLMGKTFYFNRNEAQNGKKYLTVVGKMKGDQTDKITLFPGQMPSFIHALLSEYGQYLEEEGLNFFQEWTDAAEQATEEDDGPEEEPDDGFPMNCPFCGNRYVKEAISPSGNTCWVLCDECGESLKGSREDGRDLAQRLYEARQ